MFSFHLRCFIIQCTVDCFKAQFCDMPRQILDFLFKKTDLSSYFSKNIGHENSKGLGYYSVGKMWGIVPPMLQQPMYVVVYV